MGLYSLVNVPHINAKDVEIASYVEGQTIHIAVVETKKRWGEPAERRSGMASFYLGDHMLAKPQELREMIGREIVAVIEKARAVGYGQAQADIRAALGIK